MHLGMNKRIRAKEERGDKDGSEGKKELEVPRDRDFVCLAHSRCSVNTC